MSASSEAALERSGAPLSTRVLRGMEASLLSQLVILAVNLLATPALVRGLGVDGYGLFTLIFTVFNYLLLATAGTITGTQKYTAELLAKGERGRLSRLLRGALLFELAAGFAASALLWVARGFAAKIFVNAGGDMRGLAEWVFGCAALCAPAYFAMFFATCILYGMQRFRTFYAYMTLHSVFPALAAVWLLAGGAGLREIGLAFLAGQWALAAAALFSARELLFTPSPVEPEPDFGGYARFSLKSWLPQVMWVVTFQGDRVFIGRLLPLAQLGYYAVASSLAQKFNSLCESVAITAFPILTELHGRGEEERLRRFYLKASELSAFLVLPISVMTFVLAPQFLTLWLGPEFSRLGTWPVRLLVLGNAAYLACSLPSKVATGKGSPELFGYLQAAKSVVLIGLWFVCIPRWGIMGAALGFLASEWLGTPVFVGFVHRRFLALDWAEFLAALWRPAAAALVLAALATAGHGWIGSWPEFLGFGAAGMALYYGIGYRLLDGEAREQLRERLREKLGAAGTQKV